MAADTKQEMGQLTEADALKRMLELGLLTEIRPLLSPDAIPKDRQLIPLEGRPGSWLIIEERR